MTISAMSTVFDEWKSSEVDVVADVGLMYMVVFSSSLFTKSDLCKFKKFIKKQTDQSPGRMAKAC